MLIWLGLTLAGFIITLRAAKNRFSPMSYFRGLGIGAIASIVSAVVAVIAQVGYFKVVHPAWPEVMAQQTREHFAGLGLPQAEVEAMVEQARNTFTLTNYAVQSALAAFFLGVVLTAIIMIFLRSKRRASAQTTAEAAG